MLPRVENGNFECLFTVQGTLEFPYVINNIYKDILEDNLKMLLKSANEKKTPLYINSVLSRQNHQSMPVRFQPASANHIYCLGQIQNQHSGLSTLPSTKLVN